MHSCVSWVILMALLLASSRGHVVRKRSVESGQHQHKEKEQISLLFLQPTWFSTMFDSFNSVAGVARANQLAGEGSSSDVDVALDVQHESNEKEGSDTVAIKNGEFSTEIDTNTDSGLNIAVDVDSSNTINGDLESNSGSGVNVNVDLDSRLDQPDALHSPDLSASVDVGVTPLNVDVKADVDANFDLNVINDLIGAITDPSAAINEDVDPLTESTAIPNRESSAIDEASMVEQERIERNVADFLPLSNGFPTFNGPHTTVRVDGQWRPESMHVPTTYHQGIGNRHPVYESQYRFDPHRVSPPRFYPNFVSNEGPYWRPGHTRGQGGIPNRH